MAYAHPKERTFKAILRFYFSQHRSRGCKITHMVGVPMIVASFILIPLHWMTAAVLFVVGWILQFVGHYVYEHNSPVLLEIHSPLILLAALVLVVHEWKRFLTGKPIASS